MLKVSESDVTAQVKGFFEHRGWRAVRMQRTVVPGQFQTGEPGIPDFCFVRYVGSGDTPALCLTLWIEFKARGARAKCRCVTKKPRQRCTACDQKHWRDRERARGAVVWTQVDDIRWVMAEYDRCFGWLHTGDCGRGQLELALGRVCA